MQNYKGYKQKPRNFMPQQLSGKSKDSAALEGGGDHGD